MPGAWLLAGSEKRIGFSSAWRCSTYLKPAAEPVFYEKYEGKRGYQRKSRVVFRKNCFNFAHFCIMP
jgi:hypothetical protein